MTKRKAKALVNKKRKKHQKIPSQSGIQSLIGYPSQSNIPFTFDPWLCAMLSDPNRKPCISFSCNQRRNQHYFGVVHVEGAVSVEDLLLVDRRLHGPVLVPVNMILVVQACALIRDGDDATGVVNLLTRYAHWITWDPE